MLTLGCTFPHDKGLAVLVQDGLYNIKTGNNFNTGEFHPASQSSEGCLQTLSGIGNLTNVTQLNGSTNDTATFVPRDSIAGTEQFLFQLVKAPNQYTLACPGEPVRLCMYAVSLMYVCCIGCWHLQ